MVILYSRLKQKRISGIDNFTINNIKYNLILKNLTFFVENFSAHKDKSLNYLSMINVSKNIYRIVIFSLVLFCKNLIFQFSVKIYNYILYIHI